MMSWPALAMVTSIAMMSGCAEDPQARQDADTMSATAAGASALPALPNVSQEELERDRQLAPDLRAEWFGDSARLVVTTSAGAQINALLPPVLEVAGGARYILLGRAVTADSAYFVGDVGIMLARAAFPVTGTLRTSYCRANERLCRNAERAVSIALPAR